MDGGRLREGRGGVGESDPSLRASHTGKESGRVGMVTVWDSGGVSAQAAEAEEGDTHPHHRPNHNERNVNAGVPIDGGIVA